MVILPVTHTRLPWYAACASPGFVPDSDPNVTKENVGWGSGSSR